MDCPTSLLKLIVIGCCSLLGFAPSLAADPSQNLNSVFTRPRHQKVAAMMRTGKYAQAEDFLQASVERRPAPDDYGLLGYAREMQNKFPAAEKAYRESLRLDAAFLFARVRLGIVLTKQKRNVESVQILQPVADAINRIPEALFHLCLAYLETDDLAKAVATAERMEALGPEMSLRVAKLFVWKNKFPESLPLLKRIVAANPRSAEANYLLASSLLRADKPHEMWPYLEKAYQLDPKSAPTLLLYGAGLLAEKKFGRAKERLLQAQALLPEDPRLRYLLGKALIGEGDYAGAIQQLEALARQDPDKPEVHLLLLSAYRLKGDIRATTEYARQVAQRFPGHLQSQLAAGMDLQTVGEFEQAEQALRRALALSKGNPTEQFKAKFNLATVLVKLGQGNQAVPLLKEVVDSNPAEAPARVELGDSYLRSGEYRKALQVLQEAALRDPENKRAQLLLGKVLTRLGRHQEAGKHFQAFQDLESAEVAAETATPGPSP